MSADNYYLIRKHPIGGYAAVMGFASDDDTPEAHMADISYSTVEDAVNYAMSEYSEYGVTVHPECEERKDPGVTIFDQHMGPNGEFMPYPPNNLRERIERIIAIHKFEHFDDDGEHFGSCVLVRDLQAALDEEYL